MPAEELPEPLFHSGNGIARPQHEQIFELKVMKELSKGQLVLGIDLLILTLARIRSGSDAAARENLFARAQIHGIAHAADVPANSANVTAKDRRVCDSRQTRFASEKRFENLLDFVACGHQQRKDRPRGRADQQSDLARLRIGSRPESRCEREAARFERASHAEVPEDCFDLSAGRAQCDAPKIGGPVSRRHSPLCQNPQGPCLSSYRNPGRAGSIPPRFSSHSRSG